jgi:hypothetical protein
MLITNDGHVCIGGGKGELGIFNTTCSSQTLPTRHDHIHWIVACDEQKLVVVGSWDGVCVWHVDGTLKQAISMSASCASEHGNL